VSLPVTTTPEADAQIRTIDDWWRENRRASPDLFFNELAGAIEIIASAPMVGRLYRRRYLVCAACCGKRRDITSTTFQACLKSASSQSGTANAESVRRCGCVELASPHGMTPFHLAGSAIIAA
jgi:hypothetical protein